MSLYGSFSDGRTMLRDAINLAIERHAGQVDKRGLPYIGHAMRVMATLPTNVGQTVGVLHDIFSDTDVTPEFLRARGYPEYVISAIDALTEREGETRQERLNRAAADPLALLVKIADNEDNRDPSRMSDPPTLEELSRKAMYDRESVLLASYLASSPPNPSFV